MSVRVCVCECILFMDEHSSILRKGMLMLEYGIITIIMVNWTKYVQAQVKHLQFSIIFQSSDVKSISTSCHYSLSSLNLLQIKLEEECLLISNNIFAAKIWDINKIVYIQAHTNKLIVLLYIYI